MLRLFLMLLGAEAVRRRWGVIAVAGLLWATLGLLIFLDALDGSLLFPVSWLGYAVIFEGLVSVLAGSAGAGAARGLRWAKGLGLILVGILTLETTGTGNVVLAILIGFAFATDGVLKVAAARLIRFRGWRVAQAQGVLSLVMALLTLQPLPTWYVGTIGCNVGTALFLSGIAAGIMAWRLARLPPGAGISTLLHPGRWTPAPPPPPGPPGQELVVRVWTPGGATGPRPGTAAHRQVVDRYIAAMDADGVVSTGHAALQLDPGLYISHYPAEEIDRSPDKFRAALRATAENDVRGLFKPSYEAEAAEWCEATTQVRFTQFDPARLHAFWAAYRQDTTYNLTSRNCSSAVAAALDAALEGVLGMRRTRRRFHLVLLARSVLSPELWAATLLRRRAETMTWTPGLVLDYARAIGAVVDPPPLGWLALARRAWRRIRTGRTGVSGSPRRRTG